MSLESSRCKIDICGRMSYGVRNVVCKPGNIFCEDTENARLSCAVLTYFIVLSLFFRHLYCV